mmetsp:Transcript_21771/g.44615  ORF Transcript_21771/g.44615 Transcript_21771/m.44615 type:complete len:310 (+) Transcript_21771:198-1127(+)|eukprot:CAMPEP_0201116982 /NCGR_PEP_ID=MMETSP0850-20130426/1110_1 /ASSEMBLY_ACC=CAM_ASM_000622 /TAXON_ID=183588 /ORGANISM="Pseudo-nitzschia fraudulenta, Strain WWA7" /LENGTH=309 /DNA_ID=CAMNT_0047381211 /DNA_START=174 /DNA_END=1103 /DNA_ORIENTATION=+
MRKCLKLLMFALLRSSASSIRQAATTTTTSIKLRLATRTDVPAIQRCNLACLPENYNYNFYRSHLRQWPDLALVAEEIQIPNPNEIKELSEDRHSSRNPFPNFSGSGGQQQQLNQEPKIVAYVLGKVETRPALDLDDPLSRGDRVERLGHVTSLAVQKDFRRLGLAKAMMTQLHHHLQHHGIASCGLHVRTSNLAACRLYQDDGYQIDQIIKSYYQDGEDAYFMRRSFHQQQDESSTLNRYDRRYGPGRLVKKAWKTGPQELRLPRLHTKPGITRDDDRDEAETASSSSSRTPSSGHHPPTSAELLSGI